MNLKIKVIKKNTLTNYNIPIASEKKLKQTAEREIATNVSGWVNEFQNSRREDPKQAFNSLLALCN